LVTEKFQKAIAAQCRARVDELDGQAAMIVAVVDAGQRPFTDMEPEVTDVTEPPAHQPGIFRLKASNQEWMDKFIRPMYHQGPTIVMAVIDRLAIQPNDFRISERALYNAEDAAAVSLAWVSARASHKANEDVWGVSRWQSQRIQESFELIAQRFEHVGIPPSLSGMAEQHNFKAHPEVIAALCVVAVPVGEVGVRRQCGKFAEWCLVSDIHRRAKMWKSLLGVGACNKGRVVDMFTGRRFMGKALQTSANLLYEASYWVHDEKTRIKTRTQKRQALYLYGQLSNLDVRKTWPGAIPLKRVEDPRSEADLKNNEDCDLVEGYLRKLYRLNHCLQLKFPSPLAFDHPAHVIKMAVAYTNLSIELGGEVPPSDPGFVSRVPVDAGEWDVPGVRVHWAPVEDFRADVLDDLTPETFADRWHRDIPDVQRTDAEDQPPLE
jgi:hypothetical protein